MCPIDYTCERYSVAFAGWIDVNAEKAPAAVEETERLFLEVSERYGGFMGISGLTIPQSGKFLRD
jgi:hypothetical protein